MVLWGETGCWSLLGLKDVNWTPETGSVRIIFILVCMTQAWNSDQNMIFKTWVFQKLTFSSKWVSTKSEFHFFLSFLSFSLHFSFFCLYPSPDILCVHFNPVIPWLQWLWWWPYSTMTIRCVVFDIPHPRRFCFDKTQRWHETWDFHRWTTDFKYLTLYMCPGISWFSGGKERRSAITNRV